MVSVDGSKNNAGAPVAFDVPVNDSRWENPDLPCALYASVDVSGNIDYTAVGHLDVPIDAAGDKHKTIFYLDVSVYAARDSYKATVYQNVPVGVAVNRAAGTEFEVTIEIVNRAVG